jgi:hypothetical protein
VNVSICMFLFVYLNYEVRVLQNATSLAEKEEIWLLRCFKMQQWLCRMQQPMVMKNLALPMNKNHSLSDHCVFSGLQLGRYKTTDRISENFKILRLWQKRFCGRMIEASQKDD